MSIYEVGTLFAPSISTRSGDLSVNSATGTVNFNNGVFTNVDTINGVSVTDIVNGAASSTANAIARFSDTTGKSIKNSGVIVDDSNNITGIASLSATSATINTLNSKTTADLVTGPASVTASQVATFNGTTGKVIQAVPLTIDASGNIANAGTLNGKTIADLVTGPASVTSTQLAAFSGTTGKVITNVPITVDGSGNIANAGTLNGKTIADLVTGPASATANGVPTFNGTTGKIVQSTPVTIDASGNVSGVAQLAIANAATTAASESLTVGTYNSSVFVNSVTTTDATPTVLRGYDASAASTTYSISAKVVAVRTAPSVVSAGFKLEAVFKNVAGTVTQVGTTAKLINSDVGTWDVAFSISSTTINLSVTGAASETIKWATRTRVSTLS